MMNSTKCLLLYGTAVLLGSIHPGFSQSSAIELQLYAGVNITGTPGSVHVVQSTTDATQSNSWTSLAFVQATGTNQLFLDTSAPASGTRFFRTMLQDPPTNMVFLLPGTFTMGSSTNEENHQLNESPQTRVTLSRGFWIGKYEVTQQEYLDVTGTNPSVFPGDLRRPVSSVSWPDATNYCWMLTQRELTAGRIPVGCQYRLPTEAEWEYAARAGTSSKYSYGDDPGNSSLTNYAWYFINGGLKVHPVGQKLPNPWGLYDVHGNVFEWCQDWLGDLPGGAVTDPKGPDSNPIGWKIIRGGGYDMSEADCRSARRYFYGSHPALNDSNLGFRVVLGCP